MSEVANLSLYDMDFETELIFIENGKGGKDRFVPMDADIIESAKKWLEFRPKDAEKFFCTYKGDQLNTRYIRDMTYRVSENAGVYLQEGGKQNPVNPHAFRHGYGKSLMDDGIDIRKVQELMGHTDISTTQIYTHLSIEGLSEEIKKRPRMAI